MRLQHLGIFFFGVAAGAGAAYLGMTRESEEKDRPARETTGTAQQISHTQTTTTETRTEAAGIVPEELWFPASF